ncbi:WSC domain-containing protein [Stachybotrys elegans]|uniref:WSC domain-containing protein n=1 Tax=Stachybotrys elegans TaxID=80388 RepID=A0A8K0SCK1_9HYPO|nr:WSC domain-containing protein [Stachybotrys elegans]
MTATKTILAVAALSLLQHAQATNFQYPPCLDPFQPFVYSGCFQDGSPRTLEYRSEQSSRNMTVEACVAECKGNGFRYAGLEYYGECYCGATVNSPALDEGLCNLPCNGNNTQTCGGNDALSIYQDPTFPTHPGDVDIEDYVPLGCYTDDGPNGRSLPWVRNIPQDTFTPAQCLSSCRDRGFPFAGTEYGQECYCGSVLGNYTTEVGAEECNMPCRGDASQTCGGSLRLNLYVARELLSLEPCGYEPPVDTTTTSVPTATSTTKSSSSTTKVPDTTTSSTTKVPDTTTTSSTTKAPDTTTTPSTTKFTSTTTTTSSVCTTTITPPNDCEYKVGKWCAPHFPDWEHENECLNAWKTCAKLVTSCWKYAGFPASLECLKFSSWCGDIKKYCNNDCKGKTCSKKGCFDKYKPQHPNPPKPPVTTTYPCPTTTVKTTTTKTTTTVVPEPTNICKQPTSKWHNYGPGNPVGGIELPLVTCNDIKEEFSSRPFKLYTEPDTHKCKSYSKWSCSDACKDACEEQHEECKETYVESCKPAWGSGKESPSKAHERCTAQYKDCLIENAWVDPGNRCKNWGSGLKRV